MKHMQPQPLRQVVAEAMIVLFSDAPPIKGEKDLLSRTPPRGLPRLPAGRNDPCPCGCGKKAKKCPARLPAHKREPQPTG